MSASEDDIQNVPLIYEGKVVGTVDIRIHPEGVVYGHMHIKEEDQKVINKAIEEFDYNACCGEIAAKRTGDSVECCVLSVDQVPDKDMKAVTDETENSGQ